MGSFQRRATPRRAFAASFTFVLAGGEFAATLYAAMALAGHTIPLIAFADVALPAALAVASVAAATVLFITTSRARAEVARTAEVTELLDVETLKRRAYLAAVSPTRAQAGAQEPAPVSFLAPPAATSRTRELLDTYYGARRAPAR